jgi:monofunctional glycosyltransferase
MRMMRRLGRLAGVLAAMVVVFAAYIYLTLPDVRALAATNPKTTAFMELRQEEAEEEGRKLRHVHRWTPYSRISPNLKRAVLVAEDSTFFEHEGVDLEQIKLSMEINLEKGRAVRGGSTITQQLAKNLYLSPSRNPIRKLRELIIARRLEAALPKARILELYLNLIEWGDGIWGADSAARTHFGVPAAALTPEQAALMAGAIINPRVLNPARPNRRLLVRQQLILRRMGAVTPPAPVPIVAGAAPEPDPEPLPLETLPPVPPGDPTPPEPEPPKPCPIPPCSGVQNPSRK